jgi:hypothetical protein
VSPLAATRPPAGLGDVSMEAQVDGGASGCLAGGKHPRQLAQVALHPTPCTLHHTPCTLHPAPYTLQPHSGGEPTPYTPHPTSYTLNIEENLHPSPYTLHPTSYTLSPEENLESGPAQVAGSTHVNLRRFSSGLMVEGGGLRVEGVGCRV